MNNKKETALEILRLWRIDKNLFLECQRRLQEDKAKEILELFGSVTSRPPRTT